MDILNEEVKKFILSPIIIEKDKSVREAAKIMRDNNISSILVRDEPLGIVTERDILYKVVAEDLDLNTRIAKIANKPLITIEANSRVSEAIALMSRHNIRRLGVIEGGKLIGIITQMSLVGNIKSHEESMPIIEIPKGVICPYCNSQFDTKEILSKHIDKIHIGLGILEGNVKRL